MTALLDSRNPLENLTTFKHTMLDVTAMLQSLNFDYYLQCSAALLLHGISLGEDYNLDIDMRILDAGVRGAAAAMREFVPPESQTWFGVEDKGRTLIASPHFQFVRDGYEVDIAADMRFIVDDVDDHFDIEIPNSPEWFAEAQTFILDGKEIRVASLEMLLIYYLIIERAKDSGKMDVEKISRIVLSNNFDYDKYYDLLSRYFTPQDQSAINEIVANFTYRSAVA